MKRSSQSGVSIVELLVAVAITITVAAPVLVMSSQMVKMYKRTTATLDMVQNATFGFARMSREISAAYWHGASGTGTYSVTGNKPRLLIDSSGARLCWNATSHNSNEGLGSTDGIDMVEYALSKQTHSSGVDYLWLRKKTQSSKDEVPTSDVTSLGSASIGEAIVFNLNSVLFQALTWNSSLSLTKSSSYDYTGTTTSTLPQAIRVTLTLKDPNGLSPDLVLSSDICTAR